MRSALGPTLAMLLAAVATACAATDASHEDEDQAVDEQDLTTCTLGPTCSTLPVLGARAFLNGPPPNRTRSDVRAVVLGRETVPRILAQKTSRPVKFSGGRATLSGSADGSAPLFFDDFVLVEVLGLDGRVLGRGLLSHEGHVVTVEGRELVPLAPLPPWVGVERGYRYDAGVIDLAALLPKDQSFKLRFTAFDTGGVGLVSDLHLRFSSSAEPPVTEVDPFSPSFCTDGPLSQDKALARFAPGATWANLSTGAVQARIRTRRCEPLTGCTAWTDATKMTLGTTHRGNGYSTTTYQNPPFTLPITSSAIDFEADGNELWAWVFVNTDGGTMRLRKRFDGGVAWANGFIVDHRAVKVEDPVFAGVLGEHCMRATAAYKGGREETELVIYARY